MSSIKTVSELYAECPTGSALITMHEALRWEGHLHCVKLLNKIAKQFRLSEPRFSADCEKTASFFESRLDKDF